MKAAEEAGISLERFIPTAQQLAKLRVTDEILLRLCGHPAEEQPAKQDLDLSDGSAWA